MKITLAENVQSVNIKIIEMGDNISIIDSETTSLNDNSDKMNRASHNAA